MTSLLILFLLIAGVGWWGGQFYMMLYSFIMLFLIYNMDGYTCMSGFLGGDLMSGLLILLTFWLCGLMLMASQNVYVMNDSWEEFLGLVVGMGLILYVVFGVLDLFWFYIFFELVLIPTLLMIVGWGVQPERLQAGVYMLFYTLGASLPLLLGLMYMYYNLGSLNFYLSWFEGEVGGGWILVMMLAFLVKLPMYMVHLWLPKAHVEAPVAGSMILAGVLLKLGGYGLYRVMMMFYTNIYYYSCWIISLSLIGGVVISMICICQVDLKSLIAYSSVSHMGILLGGYCTFNSWGLEGGLIMMIAHGLCSSGLFCLVNIFYERFHTRSIIMIKGMMMIFPSLGLFWFMMSMGNMASPPTINLLGEIMLMVSMIGWSGKVVIFISILSFMSVAYTIYMYSSVQHGKGWVIYGMDSISVREYLLLFSHLLPLNYLIFIGDSVGGWL
uniref:NADH-ubiquinone oxidoreductase chain 4 n=1 Tax=Eremobates cf. palpisetulosus SEM-2008 TaxID=507470 RepID=B2CKF4_9ARAC|nr:NADH dehydrogenase subunit 4 [Eremobates cf. palpisetulosus SEM-2008]ACA49842.1 NADH dehydrogenase subunit 4 [Eremobates cf. palpisetulosus SEM-2008]